MVDRRNEPVIEYSLPMEDKWSKTFRKWQDEDVPGQLDSQLFSVTTDRGPYEYVIWNLVNVIQSDPFNLNLSIFCFVWLQEPKQES